MIILKIGVTLIVVPLLCMLWSVISGMINEAIWERKHGIYYSDTIFLIIFYTSLALGITLISICGLIMLYIGGI